MVICETFQKQEENVPQSYVTLFRNRRKMSTNHSQHFYEMGGKHPIVICDACLKREESFFQSWLPFQKQEDNVHQSCVTLYWDRRKISSSNETLCCVSYTLWEYYIHRKTKSQGYYFHVVLNTGDIKTREYYVQG